MKNTNLLNEIRYSQKLMGINEDSKYEDKPKIFDNYPNIKFHSRTTNDRLPKQLLKDIQDAAKNAGIEVQVDYARTGHRKWIKGKEGKVMSRHWMGSAVDISHIDGKGWSSRESAKRNGILNGIEKFVSELVAKGYTKNSEKGQNKSVLFFGAQDHDNHIHVSNKSKDDSVEDVDTETSSTKEVTSSSSKEENLEKLLDKVGLKKIASIEPEKEAKEFAKEIGDLFDVDKKGSDEGIFKDIFGVSLTDLVKKAKSLFEQRLQEDIQKMKKPLR